MGLGAEWGGVMDALREIIPVYDRVNSLISLGRDRRDRARGVRGRLRPGDAVLDAGSGFGNMSRAALDECPGLRLVMCDPLLPMLENARRLFGEPPAASCGAFEAMPFRDGAFDAVLCGYSLRDAISLRKAISEAHRVLRPGGVFVVVDIGKPDRLAARAGAALYLRLAAPLVACAAGGRRGLRFGALYGTFRRWPPASELSAMLRERFSSVEVESGLAGAAIVVAARK